MSFPSKSGHPRYRHQAYRQISDKCNAFVVKMFDNANSQNRERNLPKTWFRSAPNALFGEKARPHTTRKACLHRKRNLFRLQKSLDYTTNKACFSRYSYRHRLDPSAKQHRNRYKPAHYPNRPFSSKTFHDTVSCTAPPFSAIRNPHSKANIRQEKPRKTALSAPHTRLLEAQTRRKAGPTPKASVGGVKTEVIGS